MLLVSAALFWSQTVWAAGSGSELSDEAIPIQPVPDRPSPILELGDPLLDTGPLHPGYEVFTGAVWQPKLLVFGTFRTAIQTFEQGVDDTESRTSEWANRLDLFTQLRLTATERFILGIRPLDRNGEFSGVRYEPDPDPDEDFRREDVDEVNFNLSTFFFEGDFAEVFPNLDPDDSARLDYGFSIGRQPLFFQEGFLINDNVDSIGISRNNLIPSTSINSRVTLVFGWADIHRRNERRGFATDEDRSASLWGLFTEHDFSKSTINFDAIYIDSRDSNDAWFVGFSGIQRIWVINTAFRVVTSRVNEQSDDDAASTDTLEASNGTLFFSEVSWTPPYTHNILYWNTFVGIDEFSSAARGVGTGGPMGRTGILFAAVGLGTYGAPLGNDANESVGSAIGYQMFFNANRTQLTLEAGRRVNTDEDTERDASAVGLLFQQAMGQRFVFRFDLFGAERENIDENRWGTRAELLVKL